MSAPDEDKMEYLDYFAGALPAKLILSIDITNIREAAIALNTSSVGGLKKEIDLALYLIGIVAFFEAYCKNQFASVGNICPMILKGFSEKREDVSIRLNDLLQIPRLLDYRLGSLLSENYDFGSAKSINSLFFDLLGITPFSIKEIKKFEKLLSDRNLLVHHGGIYTYKYSKQRLNIDSVENLAHWHSLIVTHDELISWIDFLWSLAVKITKETHASMRKIIQEKGINLTPQQEGGIDALLWE